MKKKQTMLKSKKAVVENLSPLVIGLVSLGVILVVGFLIMSQTASNATVAADANASAAIDEVQGAMDDIPGWLPIIIIVVIGVLLLALVRRFR